MVSTVYLQKINFLRSKNFCSIPRTKTFLFPDGDCKFIRLCLWWCMFEGSSVLSPETSDTRHSCSRTWSTTSPIGGCPGGHSSFNVIRHQGKHNEPVNSSLTDLHWCHNVVVQRASWTWWLQNHQIYPAGGDIHALQTLWMSGMQSRASTSRQNNLQGSKNIQVMDANIKEGPWICLISLWCYLQVGISLKQSNKSVLHSWELRVTGIDWGCSITNVLAMIRSERRDKNIEEMLFPSIFYTSV